MDSEKRATVPCRICDVESARFFQGDRETMKAAYVVTGFGDKVSKVKIVGTVTEKFVSEDGSFASLTVDDGTGAMRVRTFREESKMIDGIVAGDLIAVVGKMRNYREENYVSPDSVRRCEDPNHETMFSLEVLSREMERKKMVDEVKRIRDQMSDEELRDYVSDKYGIGEQELNAIFMASFGKVDYRPVVLDAIGKMDKGDGADIGSILDATMLDISVVESAVNELLSNGEIYEPVVGKLKRI